MHCDVHRQNTLKVGSSGRGVFRGPCACPLSADPNLYDGIAFFAVLLIFFSPRTSKFRQSLTKKASAPPTGISPLDPNGGLSSPDPVAPPLLHVLNTPLGSSVQRLELRPQPTRRTSWETRVANLLANQKSCETISQLVRNTGFQLVSN